MQDRRPTRTVHRALDLPLVVGRVTGELIAATRLSKPLAFIVRHRVAFVVIAAATRAWVEGQGPFFLHDARLFAEGGRALLRGDWGVAYGSGEIQEGPLTLLLFGLADGLASAAGVHARVVLSVCVQTAVAWGVVRSLQLVSAALGRPSAAMELIAGLFVVAAGIAEGIATTGHIGDGAIPLVWVCAAAWIQKGRAWRPCVLLVVAGVLKPWGLLGAALWALAPSSRRAWLAPLIQGVATIAICAPFLIMGSFRTLDNVWTIERCSVWALVGLTGTFGWNLRLLQAALVVIPSALMAVAWRRRPIAVWAVPGLLISLKLVFDPSLFYYYWTGPNLIAVIGASLPGAALPLLLRALLALVLYLALFPFFLGWRLLAAWTSIGVVVFAFLQPTVRDEASQRVDGGPYDDRRGAEARKDRPVRKAAR